MLKDFKAFILRGNVIDLAVGVIIGAAFGKIVTSLVNDILMPLIGLATSNVNYSNMFVLLKSPPSGTVVTTIEEAKALNLPTLNYGLFITEVIDFVIIAFIVFLIIRLFIKLSKTAESLRQRGKEAPAEEAPVDKDCPFCKTKIHIDATRCPHCTSQL
jgi:large conductance mechanosensitive channel